MNSRSILWIVVIVIIAGAAIFVSQNQKAEASIYAGFAQCLTDADATFYGSATCPHCIEQKRNFGQAHQLLQYVECNPHYASDEDLAACDAAEVPATPYWTVPGQTEESEMQTFRGRQPLAILAAATGCQLPADHEFEVGVEIDGEEASSLLIEDAEEESGEDQEAIEVEPVEGPTDEK